MPLILVTGMPGAEREALIHDVLRQPGPGNVPVLLLPTMPDVARARRELCGRQMLAGVQISQVDRFLSGLWELHGDGRMLVTDLQRTAMIRAAAATTALSELTESATTSGFLAVLERIAILQMTDPLPAGDDLAAGIARTLVTYSHSLAEHGLVELASATRVLSGRADSSWFEGPLLADRFDDLTAWQEEFFIAVAGAGVDVRLFMTGGAGHRVTESTEELIERLRAHASQELRSERESGCDGELAELQRALLTDRPGVVSTGAVTLSLAFGEEAEAERITAEVLRAKEDGIGWGDIAVAYRDTKRHHAALRRALDEAGIPAEFDVRVRFGETAYGRAVLAALDFVMSGSRTALVAFLASGYAGIAADDVDELDALWRRRSSQDPHRMIADLDRVSGDVRRFVNGAVALIRQGVRSDNIDGWMDLAGELLARAHGRTAPLLKGAAALDARAHEKLCAAVVDLAAIADMGFEGSGLSEVLAGAWISPDLRESAEAVQVMDVERIRGRDFDCVILAGLTAGEFPRSMDLGVFEPGPLRQRLLGQGVRLPRDSGVEAERLLFFLALSRARKRLILSRQKADSQGRPVRQSILLDEVLGAYGARDDEGVPLPERSLAFADLGLHPGAPVLPRRALRSVALSEGGECDPRVERARSRSAQRPDCLADEILLESLSQRSVFAVTELEQYLNCPYSWFYLRYMKPRPLAEAGDAVLAGKLAHEALAEFYVVLREERGVERVTSANLNTCLELCSVVVERVIAKELRMDLPDHLMLAQRLRRDVSRLVSRDALFLPGYTPQHFEWSFGSIDEPEEFEGFSLLGRIDRIDLSADAFVVIDYKSRRVVPGARFHDEGVLQAPLYAEVVRRRLGGRPAGSFYRSLSATIRTGMNRGVYRAELVSGPELTANDSKLDMDAVIEDAVERAAGAARGIRSGTIARSPLSDHSCDYCPVGSWCGGARA